MALLQQLHDAGIAGGFDWMHNGVFGAELRSRDRTVRWTGNDACEMAVRLGSVAQELKPRLVLRRREHLRLIQVLHDAEFSGSVAWAPGRGFDVRLDEFEMHADRWFTVEAWLRTTANQELRDWVEDSPELIRPGLAGVLPGPVLAGRMAS